jgi:predicted nucleic acid-binding protein
MKPVFVDTSYYLALLSENDDRHAQAIEWAERLLGEQVVTEYVLVELDSALAKVRDRHRFAPFVEHLLADDGTRFIPASSTLFEHGLTLFAKRPDKEWSLVDASRSW